MEPKTCLQGHRQGHSSAPSPPSVSAAIAEEGPKLGQKQVQNKQVARQAPQDQDNAQLEYHKSPHLHGLQDHDPWRGSWEGARGGQPCLVHRGSRHARRSRPSAGCLCSLSNALITATSVYGRYSPGDPSSVDAGARWLGCRTIRLDLCPCPLTVSQCGPGTWARCALWCDYAANHLFFLFQGEGPWRVGRMHA